MNFNIDGEMLKSLPKKILKQIRDTTTSKLNALLTEHQPVFKKADEYSNSLMELNKILGAPSGNGKTPAPRGPQTKDPNYDKNWSWYEKISYMIKRANKPLTSKEVGDMVAFEEDVPVDSIMGSLTARVKQGFDQKIFTREPKPGSNRMFLYSVRSK